jgi:hypothetical protein
MKKVIGWSIGIILLLFALYWVAGNFVIIDSKFRSGSVSKFGRDGFIMRTWEGELREGSVEGAINMNKEIFKFSCRDEAVAKELEKIDTRRTVKLWYDKPLLRLFWQGNTRYFIRKVEYLQ